MNIQVLNDKKDRYLKSKPSIDKETLSSYDKNFELVYTHNSTAIEGNTLTLLETKVVLEDGLAVGGKELREIYEVTNHQKAYSFIKKCIGQGMELDEHMVKDVHAILMENIMIGGVYRNQEVRISGAAHQPPTGHEMYIQIKNFYADMKSKGDRNAIELAAWTHAEFVRIHPYIDGNGRTSRLIMNYQLMQEGFLPVSIAKEQRLDYYNALEAYSVNEDLDPFTQLLADLEEKQLDEYLKLIDRAI